MNQEDLRILLSVTLSNVLGQSSLIVGILDLERNVQTTSWIGINVLVWMRTFRNSNNIDDFST